MNFFQTWIFQSNIDFFPLNICSFWNYQFWVEMSFPVSSFFRRPKVLNALTFQLAIFKELRYLYPILAIFSKLLPNLAVIYFLKSCWRISFVFNTIKELQILVLQSDNDLFPLNVSYFLQALSNLNSDDFSYKY